MCFYIIILSYIYTTKNQLVEPNNLIENNLRKLNFFLGFFKEYPQNANYKALIIKAFILNIYLIQYSAHYPICGIIIENPYGKMKQLGPLILIHSNQKAEVFLLIFSLASNVITFKKDI